MILLLTTFLASTAVPVTLETPKVEGLQLLVPTELAQYALNEPCILEFETLSSGRVKQATVHDCPEPLAALAVAAAPELIFRDLPGPIQKPKVFTAGFPFAIDRRAAKIDGKAESYPGQATWRRPPKAASTPRMHAPLGMDTQRCELLITIDAEGTVQAVRPVSCTDQALEATQVALMRWQFKVTSLQKGGLVVPVTVLFGPAEDLPAEQRLSPPFLLPVPVESTSACRFHLWRDAEGGVLGSTPVHCEPERWAEVNADLSQLWLPPSTGEAEQLCLSLDEEGMLTQPSPFDHDWAGAFKYAPLPAWPNLAGSLDPLSSECWLLFEISPQGKTKSTQPYHCPGPLREPAQKAAKFWTWASFGLPGAGDPMRFVMQVPFSDAQPFGSGHPVQGDPGLYRPPEPWLVDPPTFPIGEDLAQICWARFVVDTKGHTSEVVMDRECPGPFVREAMKALPSWRFFPAKWNGVPVESLFMLQITYK